MVKEATDRNSTQATAWASRGILTLALLWVFAGQAAGQVRFRTGEAQFTPKTPAQLEAAITALAARPDARHVVVQLDAPLGRAQVRQLEAAGLELLGYLGDHAFFASLSSEHADAAALARVGSLKDVQAIRQTWKLHPFLAADRIPAWAVVDKGMNVEEPAEEQDKGRRRRAAPADPVVAAYVLFHRDVSLVPEGWNVVLRHGALVRSELETINGMVVELPFSEIKPLADEDTVQWIEPPLPKFAEVNNSNRARVGADTVHNPPYGLDGSGVTVMVYDGGYGMASHPDFGGRLTARDSSGLSNHSTHVAGTVGGSGAASGGTYKGMAPAVTIEAYGFEQEGGLQPGFLYTDPGDLEDDYGQAINVYGADIANNSIGSNVESNGFDCTWQGDYGVTAQLIDSIVRGSLGAPFRTVWAAGNERQGSRCDVEGFGDYYSIAPPAAAKNHITVGAMNSNDDSVTSFTSWGPTDDGRMKPDISGPGCQSDDDFGVTSCSSSGGYTTMCGTSMASPTVCGLGALLLQDFRNQYPGDPDMRSSTMKVLFAHTAEDIENPGPDYKTGYGSVRIQAAVDLLRSANFLEAEVSQGETFSILVVVNPGELQAKITLAWDDEPGTPNVNPALVNDLDLRVFDASSTRYYPWTLDPLNPGASAVRMQEDHTNNIEQVVIDAPAPGAYRIEVHGFDVPVGPQPFSIAATPLLVACSPQGVVSLDRAKYACSSTATIQVVDCDLNTDDGVVETVGVSIDSTSEPAGEIVTLTETGPETAAFRGSIPLSTTDGAGVLLIANGDTVTATYIDADDGMGGINVTVTDTAVVDCDAPTISNVQVSNIGPRSATITFDTNEPTNCVVRYGLSCGSLTETAVEGGFDTAHTFNLTGLDDSTTYFFAIDATDEAGNATTDDNGGDCYNFATPEIPDLFTEEFAGGDNDLDNFTILWVPNASIDFYAACGFPIIELPTDPAGGTTISLSDDSSSAITLAGGATVSLYGTNYSTFYVGSNGYITFTAGDSDYTESLADHFDLPRISALFDDLNPSVGGTVSWKQLSDRAVVTWENVPEYGSSNSNTFQIEIYFDGRIQVSFMNLDAADGIAGLSEGLGVSPDFFETDLSAVGDCGPRPPNAQGQTIDTPQDTPLPITLLASDDGLPDPPAALTYIIVSLPTYELRDTQQGNVIEPNDLPYTIPNGGNEVTYTPSGGFIGQDGFQFKANDGGTPPDGGDSNIATVTLNVLPVLSPPFLDEFPATSFDPNKWAFVSAGATIDGIAINPPSAPYAARFNGTPDGGDEIRTHLFNLSGLTGVRLSYAWQQTGGGESPDDGDDLFVEYLDNTGTWQLINQHLGSGPDMTTFQTEDVLLPPDALHVGFRLRIRNTATSGAFDDWFVDDVALTMPDAPTANDMNVQLDEDTPVDIVLDAVDPTGDPLDYIIESLPADGALSDVGAGGAPITTVPYTLAGGGNVVRYTPAAAYTGPDAFDFSVTDGTHASNVATVWLTVGQPSLVFAFTLDTIPAGWTRTGLWKFGQPTGGGSHDGDPNSGYTGSMVYGYNLGGDYANNMTTTEYLTTAALNCSNVRGTQLRFRRWLGVDAASLDQANIRVSNDGTSWTTVWENGTSAISESSWSLQTYNVSAVADEQPTVYIQWGMGPTDGSVTYPGWNIDDIEIWGFVPPPALGDFDGDGDVDLDDFGSFAACFNGSNRPPATECPAGVDADLDGDGDVDLDDFAIFAANYTGSL